VYASLAACLGHDTAAARAAGERLQRWERTAAPGFWAGLATIASRSVRARRPAASSAAMALFALRLLGGACPCCAAAHSATAAPQEDVAEDVRLLAVVTLKNAVGATWRKTLASRGAPTLHARHLSLSTRCILSPRVASTL
jgi:hypothetical protein